MGQLTFGGVPLMYDKSRRIQDFLDRYQPLEALAEQITPPCAWSRLNNVTGNAQNVGLAVPNYPHPPRPKLNQLYWPTGASRWAQGFFLVHQDDLEKITVGTAQTLVFDDGLNTQFEASLYALSPRPVTCEITGSTNNRLWIVPLVDERYFWQFRNAGDISLSSTSTWSPSGDLGLSTALGISISQDTVAAAYLIPDFEELQRKYENAAIMLDAVAWSVGQRVTRSPSGTVKMQGWTAAATQLTSNLEDYVPWWQIAGGTWTPGPVPASVKVAFPWLIDHIPVSERIKVYTKTPASTVKTQSGSVKLIHSTCYARGLSAASTPSNDTALDALAAQIAADYYLSLTKGYDHTFQGGKKWEPCAYDDHMLYTFGAEIEMPLEATGNDQNPERVLISRKFARNITLRVQSSPINFGTDHQLSQDSDNKVLRGVQMARLNADLTHGSYAAADILWNTGSAWADSTIDVDRVYDYLSNTGESVLAETRIIIEPKLDAPSSTVGARWVLVTGNCGVEA